MKSLFISLLKPFAFSAATVSAFSFGSIHQHSLVRSTTTPDISTSSLSMASTASKATGRSMDKVVAATQALPIVSRLIGTVDIDGAGTEHPLPEVDPFMLLDMAKVPKNEMPPFGAHPHRGHSVVSILTQGKVSSWDSFRPEADPLHVISAPASYWVDAGTGLFHDELSVVENEDDPSQHMHMFQLWIGIKEEDRQKPPQIQYDENLPTFECHDPNGEIVGKGIFHVGPQTKITTPHPIVVAHIHQDPNSTYRFPVDRTHNGFVVHCKGYPNFGGVKPERENDVMVLAAPKDDSEEEYLEVTTQDAAADYLICTGEPHGEKWYKKLVANGAIIAATPEEARAMVPQVEAMSKAGKAGGSFTPFGRKADDTK